VRTIVVLALLGALAVPAAAEESAEEVLACLRRNAPRSALVQSVELIAVGRGGEVRTQSAKLSVKRFEDGLARLLLRVEEPADLRGTAFLLIQKKKGSDVFVYLPELKKVRRVSARQLAGKLLGTDFSYEDAQRLFAQGSEGDAVRLADAEKEGRPVYVIEATPAEDSGSAYRKVTSFVDRETCVPLEIAFYAEGGTPRKRLTVDPARITKEGEVWVPRSIEIRDLERETESRIVTHAVEVDPKLPDLMFTRGALEAARK
jgi:outer membrane lipoprotein-sorting protein